jgi:NADPH2:quinone reductase
MKAVIITKPGGPEVLQLQDRPMPEPAPGEVLIKVSAAGVNRPDVAQRKGNYPPPAGASADIPGLEIAGVIVATGSVNTRWKIGDKVCALTIGGGYAEYCAVPAGQCLSIPANLSMVEAASLPETWMTVWSNVFDRAGLVSGETLLVHGGSGGIGTAAIQLATAAGAKVIATAGSEEKCNYCKSLGAWLAIDYKKKSFVEVIRNLPADKRPNVILDMVGGGYTNNNLEILAEDGRLVLINYTGGDESLIKLSSILRKRLTITGSTLRSRSIEFKTSLAIELEKNAWSWLINGTIKPIIDQVLSLGQAREAHERMESGVHMGKIILTT